MTEQDALYRAIIANPEEDTPRLVYADWLEEHGRDEEAEFIRLDCRLGEGSLELPDYVELSTRREELRLWLQAHAPHSQLKLKGRWLLPGGWWISTARGFPRQLYFTSSVRLGAKEVKRCAAALEHAFKHLPTRWVSVGFGELDDLAEFLKQPVVEAISHLRVSELRLPGDDAAQLLANSNHLRNLTSAAFELTPGEAGATALARSDHLMQLRSFSLGRESISAATVRALAAAPWFRNLTEIAFTGDGLSTEAFEELGRVPVCKQLQWLNLAGGSFSLNSWREFARVRSFPGLKQLFLRNAELTEGRTAALAECAGFRLVSLDLSLCAIGDGGLIDLLKAPWIASLRKLDLEYNGLSPTGGRILAACERLEGLEYLDLSGNPLGVGGLRAVFGSRNLRRLLALLLSDSTTKLRPGHLPEFLRALNSPRLRHLGLSGLPVDRETAEALGRDKFRTLRRLSLTGCQIRDEAASVLLTSAALNDLIELDLDQNDITTAVKHLSNRRVLPQLSQCSLYGNPIDQEIARKLARRPGIQVVA